MTVEQAREVLTVEAEGITAVRDALGEEFVRAVDLIMGCPTRLVISGIGKSGLVGQKISATLNSTGTPSFFSTRWKPCTGTWGCSVPQMLFWLFPILVRLRS